MISFFSRRRYIYIFWCLFALLSTARSLGASDCASPESLRRRFSPGALKCPGCNVVLIDIDGLRWDRLGYAGYKGDTSPFIDSLARRGIVFRNAMAQSTWTHPSVVSIATSLYPAQHGVGSTAHVLKPSTPTLFSKFGARGYRLFGHDKRPFTAEGKLFMDTGQASFDTPQFAPEIKGAIDRMSTSSGTPPSLLYIITMDLHEPYLRIHLEPGETVVPGSDAARYRAFEASQKTRGYLPGVAQEDIAFVRRMYDNRVRYVDDKLRDIFTALEKKGLSDRTIIMLFSNHGESIFEHSMWGHGLQPYEEEVHVPLLMLHPKINAKNAAEICPQVELIDLAPTLFDMVDFGVSRFGEGQSLRPLIDGTAGMDAFKYAFSEVFQTGLDPIKMVRTAEWKLVKFTDTAKLYNLTLDIAENADTAKDNPKVLEELSAILRRWEEIQKSSSTSMTREPSEAEKVWLRKNGYW